MKDLRFKGLDAEQLPIRSTVAFLNIKFSHKLFHLVIFVVYILNIFLSLSTDLFVVMNFE